MRMAAALRGHVLSSVSLASVAKTLGLGEKGRAIHDVKGLRRSEIMNDPSLWRGFQDYAINDNDISRKIFVSLIQEFPQSEWKVMDRVLRCAVQPRFKVDTTMLRDHLYDLEVAKCEALIEAGAPTTMDDPDMPIKLEDFAITLRSNPKFEEILKGHGVESSAESRKGHGVDIEYKQSVTDPDRLIPAFAKTDEFMADLQTHDDPAVQSLAVARLGLRSTIEKSRGEKILAIASLPWPSYCAGNMPVPLRYSGAHTHRLSGEWKINMQNLPAGRGSQVAPNGHKVLVADLSQIECRIAAWLCGEDDLMDQFTNKLDPYSILASKIFGFEVDKNKDPLERFIGKAGVLGLGFGCGADKFNTMVLRQARGMGMDMESLLKVWTPALAQKSVDTYRQANPHIRRSWSNLNDILDTSWCGATDPQRWGPHGCVEIGTGYVKLPNDMKLVYDVQPYDNTHSYRYGKKTYRMYGPKFLENIVQALARVVVMHAALRLWDRGYQFCLQAHDELAFIVRDEDADNAKAIVLEEMRRRPSWAKTLPLDAEANYGPSYGDAK